MGTELLESLADAYGTPLYVLDLDRLHHNLVSVSQALAPARVLYSFKTNYLPQVTAAVREHGLGMDVVSGYELREALRRGFAGSALAFNGPVKLPPELTLAVETGTFVNIDAEHEIGALAQLAQAQRTVLDVGLRIFPSEDVYSPVGSVRSRQLPSKFGWPIADGDAERIGCRIAATPQLRLTGLHVHLGSQIVNQEALERALRSVLRWAAESPFRPHLERLNLGGGFGVAGIQRLGSASGPSQVATPAGHGAPRSLDLAGLWAAVRQELADTGLDDLNVWFEPGRVLVSDAISLLTSVAGIKHTSAGTWVLLDGGLNLLPTAGTTETHRFEALRSGAPESDVFIGGPLCYEGDVFSLKASLPSDVRIRDRVLIHDAGAYSITRATSFNRPRAAAVAVRQGTASLCWRRETDEDIFGFVVDEPMVSVPW